MKKLSFCILLLLAFSASPFAQGVRQDGLNIYRMLLMQDTDLGRLDKAACRAKLSDYDKKITVSMANEKGMVTGTERGDKAISWLRNNSAHRKKEFKNIGRLFCDYKKDPAQATKIMEAIYKERSQKDPSCGTAAKHHLDDSGFLVFFHKKWHQKKISPLSHIHDTNTNSTAYIMQSIRAKYCNTPPPINPQLRTAIRDYYRIWSTMDPVCKNNRDVALSKFLKRSQMTKKQFDDLKKENPDYAKKYEKKIRKKYCHGNKESSPPKKLNKKKKA